MYALADCSRPFAERITFLEDNRCALRSDAILFQSRLNRMIYEALPSESREVLLRHLKVPGGIERGEAQLDFCGLPQFSGDFLWKLFRETSS